MRGNATDLQTAAPTDLVPTPKMSKVSERWNIAWAEFSREHPGMKRISSLTAFLVFTFLGQSILGLIQYASPFLPWFAWPIMALATTVLAQMFIGHFSAVAYHRINREAAQGLNRARQEEKERLNEQIALLKEEIAESKRAKLTFEVLTEIWNSKVSLDDPGDTEDYRDATTFFLTAELFLRFYNDDLHPIRLKKDIGLTIITPSGPVPLSKHINPPNMQKSGVGDTTYFTGFVIPGKEQTEPIFFRFFVDVPRETALSVDKNSFLRVTIKAGTQDPYSVDVNVPWRASRKRAADVTIRPPELAE